MFVRGHKCGACGQSRIVTHHHSPALSCAMANCPLESHGAFHDGGAPCPKTGGR